MCEGTRVVRREQAVGSSSRCVPPVDAPAKGGPHRLARGHLVCCQHHVERAQICERLTLQQLALLPIRRVKTDDAQRGGPFAELGEPRGEDGEGADDEVRTGDLQLQREYAEEGDRLHRLAQPHVVGEDAVDAVPVRSEEPVDALHLMGLEVHLQPRERLELRLRVRKRLLGRVLHGHRPARRRDGLGWHHRHRRQWAVADRA